MNSATCLGIQDPRDVVFVPFRVDLLHHSLAVHPVTAADCILKQVGVACDGPVNLDLFAKGVQASPDHLDEHRNEWLVNGVQYAAPLHTHGLMRSFVVEILADSAVEFCTALSNHGRGDALFERSVLDIAAFQTTRGVCRMSCARMVTHRLVSAGVVDPGLTNGRAGRSGRSMPDCS